MSVINGEFGMEKVRGKRTSNPWETVVRAWERVGLALFVAFEVFIPVFVMLFVMYLSSFR